MFPSEQWYIELASNAGPQQDYEDTDISHGIALIDAIENTLEEWAYSFPFQYDDKYYTSNRPCGKKLRKKLGKRKRVQQANKVI